MHTFVEGCENSVTIPKNHPELSARPRFLSGQAEGKLFFVCVVMSYLVSTVLLQLLVELQGDADHHFGLVPIGVGDVVQDAIEVCGRNEKKAGDD